MMATILAHLRHALPQAETPEVVFFEDIDVLGEWSGRLENGSVAIVPLAEQAEANPLATGGFRQRVPFQFIAAVLIRNHDQLEAEDRAIQFDAHRQRLEQALAGRELPGFCSPIQLVGGEGSPLDVGVSIYVTTWEAARFLTGA